MAEFARGGAALSKPELQRIVKIEPQDPSRNLNGAVRLGLERLSALLAAKDRRVPVGTLVVFTGGPDLAGRVSSSDAQRALDESPHAVITIAVATNDQQGSALAGYARRIVNAHDWKILRLRGAAQCKDEYQRNTCCLLLPSATDCALSRAQIAREPTGGRRSLIERG